jgi:hypothetical protein
MPVNDAALEALWKKVCDEWDDDAAHGAFLQYCDQADQLVEAAVRYRGMTGDHEKGSTAEKRLRGVAMLAMAKLETQRAATPAEVSRIGSLVVSAFFVVATGVLVYTLYR